MIHLDLLVVVVLVVYMREILVGPLQMEEAQIVVTEQRILEGAGQAQITLLVVPALVVLAVLGLL
jgi:hypothetical protein